MTIMSDHEASVENEWAGALTSVLSGINRYNPVNINFLEQYVQFQVENISVYNFEANLALMKLYQFNPTRFNLEIASNILLKSIMALPKVDLALLISVLPLNQQTNEELSKITMLCTHLESCNFSEFWSSIEDCNDIICKVNGFEVAVKHYIIDLINSTYQTISTSQVKAYLGNISDNELEELALSNGWSINGDDIFIKGQEDLIKPKRILAKIDLESVGNIISSTH